jgi:hypothetical protein
MKYKIFQSRPRKIPTVDRFSKKLDLIYAAVDVRKQPDISFCTDEFGKFSDEKRDR